jgi:23S rRNA (cytosine1962-C5)-methyltransferase
MERVALRRSSRVRAGHLWIFSNELQTSPKRYEPGSLVEVYEGDGGFLGIGYINPQSLIAIRLLTRKRETIDAQFFRDRMSAALRRREEWLGTTDSCRVIYSESDFCPGLIVDKYGECVVVQSLTLGMERLKEAILAAVEDVLRPQTIVFRNDSPSRLLEGLHLERQVIKGSLERLPVITEGEVSLEVDPLKGQKTGFFLDQRENRIAFAQYARGGRALDLFCYTGAWGLQLARKGVDVTFVDESQPALDQVKRNASRNNLTGQTDAIRENVMDFLKRHADAADRYRMVVLDPPAFVKSRAQIREAMGSYRKVNAMAMKIVEEGGMLATSSCSHHVDRETFLAILRSAAKDAARSPRLIETRSQARDHPVLLSVPETEYLKCIFLAF